MLQPIDIESKINQNLESRHTPFSETDLLPDEGTIPLIRAVQVYSTRNAEP